MAGCIEVVWFEKLVIGNIYWVVVVIVAVTMVGIKAEGGSLAAAVVPSGVRRCPFAFVPHALLLLSFVSLLGLLVAERAL